MTHERLVCTRCFLAINVALCIMLGVPISAHADVTLTAPEHAQLGQDRADAALQEGGLAVAQPSAALASANLSGLEDTISRAIGAWSGTASSVTVDASPYSVPASDFDGFSQSFLDRNPQYFYVTSPWSYGYSSDSGIVTTVTIGFDTSYSKRDIAAFNSAVASAVSGIDAAWGDEQKILYLHDYLVTHCEYDSTLSNYNAYDALVTGSAVCQGYALAFEYLMSRIGIPCDIISSITLNHAWNAVTLNGSTYYVDCTWDDPANVHIPSYCGHSNLLRSKNGITATGHNSTDWTDTSGANAYSAAANNTTYDSYYWSEVIAPIPQIGNLAAYVDSKTSADVYVHDYASSANRKLATIEPGTWYVWQSSSSMWTSHYTGLASDGVCFFVSGPSSIYRLTPSGTLSSIHSLTQSEAGKGYVYGITYDTNADVLNYYLCTVPSGDDSKPTYTGKLATGMATASVTGLTAQTYTGSALKPVPVVKINGATLVNGVDYTLSYSNNVKAGTARIIITGAGSYAGSTTKTFAINKAPITKASFSKVKTQKLKKKGKAVKPSVTVKFGKIKLKKGVDGSVPNVGVTTRFARRGL